MRSIRKTITEAPKTLAEILMFQDATVVLHNFLNKQGLDDELLEEWDDDISLADAHERLPDDDELNQEAYDTDNLRWAQLMAYLLEADVEMV